MLRLLPNKIKVAFVISYINQNGPSRIVLNLTKNLDQQVYSITLITLFSSNDQSVVKEIRGRNISVYECQTLNRLGCICGKDREFKEVVEKGNYDVIHSHGMIPDIVSSRLSCRAKRISTIHCNMFEDYSFLYGAVASKIYIALHLNALRKIDRCICCSSSIRDALSKRLKKISFIRNGIDSFNDEHPLLLRDTLSVPRDAFVLLFAGPLNKRKNVVWLIKEFVACHHENDYLLVLGTGEKENECRTIMDEHVKMIGFQKNVAEYMKSADIYVSASKSEGLSIAVIEALSFGTGLLLSDIPSHREIFEIQRMTYLGELFTQLNFREKYEQIRKKAIDRNAIIDFQKKELSAMRMTKEYLKEYNSKR